MFVEGRRANKWPRRDLTLVLVTLKLMITLPLQEGEALILLRSRLCSFLCLGSISPEGVKRVMSRCRGEKSSPSLKKVDRAAFAGLETW